MKHPGENDLALLAGGETGRIQRFFLDRHVRNCEDCQQKVAGFLDLRTALMETELPDLNWNFLAMEMRANIRLGLEAGACVRTTHLSRAWGPRLAVAAATLLVLVGTGFLGMRQFLTGPQPYQAPVTDMAGAVLQPTGSGIELRKGSDSFSLVDHQGVRADQTVIAQGQIQARYINHETGSVTINNVYLQ
jgi:hypothetical protein